MIESDNQKFNELYKRIKNFEFPEFENEAYQQLCDEVKQGFEIILNGIKSGASKIK